jgi:tRNA-splicing ligase RtcB
MRKQPAKAGCCDAIKGITMEPQHIHEDVPGGVPLKMWTQGVPVEDAAKRQLMNAARLPIVFKHIAAMPDVHFGIGATVGSVIPTVKAIIPAAVGVDIGCGMRTCPTTWARCAPPSSAPCRTAASPAAAIPAPGRSRPAR